jgi:hypothetical protein
MTAAKNSGGNPFAAAAASTIKQIDSNVPDGAEASADAGGPVGSGDLVGGLASDAGVGGAV